MADSQRGGQGAPSSGLPFFNRELSWIDFNGRVLAEGLRRDLPPLDRLKFLAIVSSNFDEFFMVRVAAVKRALASGGEAFGAGGMDAGELLRGIAEKTRAICASQYACFRDEVVPGLAAGGLALESPETWTAAQRAWLEDFFLSEILPALTPLRLEASGPLPAVENIRIHAAFLLEPEDADTPANAAGEPADRIALVCLPKALERIVRLPREPAPAAPGEEAAPPAVSLALLEDLVLVWGSRLFPGYRVREKMLFKLNRDADFSVDERRDEDFVEAMEEVIEGREVSAPVRMVHSPGSAGLRDTLAARFGLASGDLYEVSGPFNLGRVYETLTRAILPLLGPGALDKLQEKPWKVSPHPAFRGDEAAFIFDRISQGDIVLHLPYQSFDPVVRFFQEAAADPQVLAIKTALYRVSGGAGGSGSPAVPAIIRALEQAGLAGKHVTAVVELKARFDEERNISWANRLERAGVIVVYGLARLKVHAKATLVLRRENERVKRYVHLSTGNYNEVTAKAYEDICLFTADEDIAYDTGLLFNMMTGYSSALAMRRLVIAPTGLKRRLLELIEREARRSRPEAPGRVMAKLNALADGDIIAALYRASAAGVKVSLNIRGICLLVPGLPGLSENITVVSVVDRNLEHSRVYSFGAAGSEEIYLSSADWMPRNMERRVELMFPVEQEDARREVREILAAYFRDNCQAWRLESGGGWKRLTPRAGEKTRRAQEQLRKKHAAEAASPVSAPEEFSVRRSRAAGMTRPGGVDSGK